MKNLILTFYVIYVYLFHQVILNNACRTDLDDVTSRTYLAPIIVEGLLIAKSVPVLHRYIATFNIKKIHKGVLGETIPTIILEFENLSVKNGSISHNCAFQLNLDINKVYILFLEHSFTTDSFNFTIFAEPVLRTKNHMKDLNRVIKCKNCGTAPTAKLKKIPSTTLIDKELNLECTFKGFPPPKIAWLKDGEPIKSKNGIKIVNNKGRKISKLRILKVKLEDTGEYVCMVSNVIGPPALDKVQVTVSQVTQLWKEMPCKIENFCQNGGTCTYYETLNSHVCHCANGFSGYRCTLKDTQPETEKVVKKYPVIVTIASICGGLFILLLILLVYHCYRYYYSKKKKRLCRHTIGNTSGAYLASNGGVPMHCMPRANWDTDESKNRMETSFMSSGEPASSDVLQIQEYDSPKTNSPNGKNNKMRKYGISSFTDLEQENMVFIEPPIIAKVISDSKLATTPPATRKQMPVNNFPHIMTASSFKPHRIHSLPGNFLSQPVSSEKFGKQQLCRSLSCVDNKERNNLVKSTLSVSSEENLTSHSNGKNSRPTFKNEYEEIQDDYYASDSSSENSSDTSSDSSFSKNNSGIALLDQDSFAIQNNFAHSDQDSAGNLSWDEYIGPVDDFNIIPNNNQPFCD